MPGAVCGEMASDPASALLLLGIGVDSLSMNPSYLPRVKWTIRSFTKQKARELSEKALTHYPYFLEGLRKDWQKDG